MNEAFVYCWTDHDREMYYIGYHKGTEDDGYICSSPHMLEQYYDRPEAFTREIVASGTCYDMAKFERTLLYSLDARNDPTCYNRTNGPEDGWTLFEHSEKSKRLMSKNRKGLTLGEKNGMFGKTHSIEARKKISEAAKKRVGDKNSMWGKKQPTLAERNRQGRGKHWYTNGIDSIQCFECDAPHDWIRGRTVKK